MGFVLNSCITLIKFFDPLQMLTSSKTSIFYLAFR